MKSFCFFLTVFKAKTYKQVCASLYTGIFEMSTNYDFEMIAKFLGELTTIPSKFGEVMAMQCVRCGKPNTQDHICIPPFAIKCVRCGKPNTQDHICIPQLPRCSKCGQVACVCFRIHPILKEIIPWPIPRPFVQRVVPEKEISKLLEAGWVFNVQLQSGNIIMEKAVDVGSITKDVIEQAQKQIESDISKVDIEKVMEQAQKQIESRIEKEKQKLLRE